MAAHALELALDDLRPRSRPPSLGGSRSGLPSLTRRSPRALDLAIELPPDLFQRGRILDCSTNESIVRLPVVSRAPADDCFRDTRASLLNVSSWPIAV